VSTCALALSGTTCSVTAVVPAKSSSSNSCARMIEQSPTTFRNAASSITTV